MRYASVFLAILTLSVGSIWAEPAKSYTYSFEKDYQGWEGDFCDYPVGEEVFYELGWGWENVPDQESKKVRGMFLSGNNHSDDLFMFLRKKITGLKPHTQYALKFSVVIETNAPEGVSGIGGAPGESVYFKVGASAVEPKKVAKNNFYQLSVDKGDQSGGGKNAMVIGTLANPNVDPDSPQYSQKQLKQEVPLKITSDKEGQLWVFLGTDSGFEGPTKFYVTKVMMQLDTNTKTQSHKDTENPRRD